MTYFTKYTNHAGDFIQLPKMILKIKSGKVIGVYELSFANLKTLEGVQKSATNVEIISKREVVALLKCSTYYNELLEELQNAISEFVR